ncbi:uncharacterized protein LOC103375851, partial [Stegastes partitus]|uniref:Uncharacterized protein LOC103375851 n=1 Tax=Stegastes partitus TaxID=144197 RepID=A0A9Y4NVL0_9TELE
MFYSFCSSFVPLTSDLDEQTRFLGNLFCAAAEKEKQTGEKILDLLSSMCNDETLTLSELFIDDFDDDIMEDKCNSMLDMFSHVKDCETKTGLSVLPSLQSVIKSTPEVWSIDLSERKSSILLEVLKLQSEKKVVYLTGCSDEESEVRTFLQCLPYILHLSFSFQKSSLDEETSFLGNLFCAAAEREQQTGEKILELLSSACNDLTLSLSDMYIDGLDDDTMEDECNSLMDMFSHVKNCETKTGLSVLPSLQPVFQSNPAVWFIDLSERKTSILLEVLKLQSETKKKIKLTGCSDEESEVRSFLQCLPYISQLSFVPQLPEPLEDTRFFGYQFSSNVIVL